MKTISFFSYKGGSGRTSLMYNTLPYIAKELGATNEAPLIVADFDIDSKGISLLLNAKSEINTIQVLKGDFGSSRPIYNQSIANHPFFKSLMPIGEMLGLDANLNSSVLLVSANVTNDDNRYINGADNFDSKGRTLNQFSVLCERNGCKGLVMDTPAGYQLASDLSLGISDTIVTVMRITKQFRTGTLEYLDDKNKIFNGKNFVIVPNAVPPCSNSLVKNTIDNLHKNIENIPANNNFILSFLENDMDGINEVNSFKFEEQNLLEQSARRDLTQDELMATEKYKFLAEIVSDVK